MNCSDHIKLGFSFSIPSWASIVRACQKRNPWRSPETERRIPSRNAVGTKWRKAPTIGPHQTKEWGIFWERMFSNWKLLGGDISYCYQPEIIRSFWSDHAEERRIVQLQHSHDKPPHCEPVKKCLTHHSLVPPQKARKPFSLDNKPPRSSLFPA